MIPAVAVLVGIGRGADEENQVGQSAHAVENPET